MSIQPDHGPDYAAMSIAEILIKRHEGEKLKPYQCSEGYLTIGIGRNLDTRGISKDESDYLFANDLQLCLDDLKTFHWWSDLTSRRKSALLDLRFCVGAGGFRGFRKMIAAIERQDWQEATVQLMDSKFAVQTGSRADDLARLLADG